VADSYRVLIIEDDPDPTTYLRLALLRTRHAEHRVRCPAAVRALLRGVNRSTQQPMMLILDEAPTRLEVLTAYFGDAGCAVIATPDVEQALMICSVVCPDLMVLPEQRPGMDGAGLDKLRSQHPNCPIAVTSVLAAEADPITARPHTSRGPSLDERAPLRGRVRQQIS